MTYNIYIPLETGRTVKLMLRLSNQSEAKCLAINCDVFVKDPGQTVFRQPLTIQHPKYRQFKNQGPEKLELMQIAYSGITQTQFEQAIGAFKRDLRAGVMLEEPHDPA